jgi:hypothetical protein
LIAGDESDASRSGSRARLIKRVLADTDNRSMADIGGSHHLGASKIGAKANYEF